MLLVVWVVSLQLTKQRIVLEAENKLQSIQSSRTPFVWDFVHFSQDVVESFQQYWQYNPNKLTINANQGSNPQLSLNFSGQTFSPLLHDKLIIYSRGPLNAQVSIQAKIDTDEDIFYYLPVVDITQTTTEIDLSQAWSEVIATGKKKGVRIWGKDLMKISSLVLIFKNPNNAIEIEKIELPFNHINLQPSRAGIDCQGQVDSASATQLTQFELNQACFFPSNYMWLKHKLNQQFPESILSIPSVHLWQKPTEHYINKSYTSNILLNAVLYGVMIVCFVIIFWQRKINAINDAIEKQQPWYKWAAKQMLFKGAKTAIKPYHLLINYAVVLIPTLMVLVVMAFIQFPELMAFKKLPLYFLWALIQQFFLGYVLAERIFYDKTKNRLLSALLAAAVFSVLHAPSATLILATFIAGGLWAYAFLVFKRLLPLALSHAVLALMFYHIVSDRVLYTAKVMQWFWE